MAEESSLEVKVWDCWGRLVTVMVRVVGALVAWWADRRQLVKSADYWQTADHLTLFQLGQERNRRHDCPICGKLPEDEYGNLKPASQ